MRGERVHIYIPRNVRARIEKIARTRDLSLSAFLREAAELYLKLHERGMYHYVLAMLESPQVPQATTLQTSEDGHTVLCFKVHQLSMKRSIIVARRYTKATRTGRYDIYQATLTDLIKYWRGMKEQSVQFDVILLENEEDLRKLLPKIETLLKRGIRVALIIESDALMEA